jgi:hypothetical protein
MPDQTVKRWTHEEKSPECPAFSDGHVPYVLWALHQHLWVTEMMNEQ